MPQSRKNCESLLSSLREFGNASLCEDALATKTLVQAGDTAAIVPGNQRKSEQCLSSGVLRDAGCR